MSVSNNVYASTFNGKHVVLQPTDMHSLKHLYSWYLNLEFELAHLMHDVHMIPNELTFKDEFLGALKNTYHLFLFIYLKGESNRDPIGYVSTYKFSKADGYIHFSMFLIPEYRKMYYSIEAGIMVFNYLFMHYSIRKVCSTVFGYNEICANLLISIGFAKDGELRKHKYYNGKYHNVLVMSLFKEDFYKSSQKYLDRLQKSHTHM